MATAYITHPDCLLHESGEVHPESSSRLRAINDQLIASRLMDLLRYYNAPLASREQLCRVHPPAYLDRLAARAPEEGLVMLDPDTFIGPHSLQAAYRAAGAAVQAVDLVTAGDVQNAFCAVRPPGHHAESERAMGFCLFNNIAVGVAHALEHHGFERVAVLDFDVHHGNGTEKIFRNDERVLLCSTFQHPFYPFTDLDDSPSNIIHAPLRGGSKGEDLQRAVRELWLPELESFRPQFIFVSAGFDGHVEDDMSDLVLVDGDYAALTEQIMAVAAHHAGGRIVSALEGGYALEALGRSVAAHIRVMMGV